MKRLIGINLGSYSFNPATKQVVITDAGNLKLEQLLLITNVTTNTMIYNFADSALGATLSNNVITLDYDTTSMSSSDNLQIFVEVSETADLLLGLSYQISLLTDVVKSLAQVDTQNRQRVVVDSGSIIVTSGSITAAASTNEIGKVTQTYSDAQVQGEIAFDVSRTKLSF